MRLLHLIPSIAEAHGGPSAAVSLMAESLAARGFGVTIATTDDAGPRAWMSDAEQGARRTNFAAKGIELVITPKRTEFYKFSPGLALWLWRNVRSFDVVHIHALFSFSSVAAGWIAAIRKVPFILRPLGVLGQYGMSSRRPALKRLSFATLDGPLITRAAAVHFTSENERDEALVLGRELRPVVLPLGVPVPAAADPGPLLREIGAPPGRPRLLFLSRIDQKKNLDGLLQALARLDHGSAAAPFLMVAGNGDPKYVASLRSLAVKLGLEGSVAWMGRVEGDRKSATWAAADIFVLPSHSENFGIAAAEAMLAGLPSILGEGVAIAADAAAAGAACLTSTGPEQIAARLSDLLSAPATALAMGERARVYAAERFSTHVMADRLEALYVDVVASSGRAPRVDPANMAHLCK